MKNILLALLLIALSTCALISQEEVRMETITYSDGSIFKGRTIEKGEFEVQFELLSTGDTIILKRPLIDRWINSDDYLMFKGNRFHKKSGYFKSLNFSAGGNEWDGTMQVDFKYGKLLQPRLAVGFGLGYNYSTANSSTWEGLSFGEVFLYGKYYVNDNRRRFFVDSKLGASIALGSSPWLSYTSGPLFQPGIGFEFATSKKIRWSLKLSQFTQYTVIRPSPDSTFRGFGFSEVVRITDKRLFNRTLLSLGINF